MLKQSGDSRFPRSAAGVVALYSAGIYEGEEIDKGLTYLRRHLPQKTSARGAHFFYGQYYGVQAMWHAGGEYWNEWYPAIRNELVKSQAGDGSWPSSEAGPEYGAAMASIILQIPLNYLPVFSP